MKRSLNGQYTYLSRPIGLLEMDRQLSTRELAVVALAAIGKTDKEIAHASQICLSTVRTYWDRIRKKTRTNSRTHAVCVVLMALENSREFLEGDFIHFGEENAPDHNATEAGISLNGKRAAAFDTRPHRLVPESNPKRRQRRESVAHR